MEIEKCDDIELTLKLNKEQSVLLLNALDTYMKTLNRSCSEIVCNDVGTALVKEFNKARKFHDILDRLVYPPDELLKGGKQ